MATQWTNDEFANMGWHDCYIHGLRFGEFNPEWGACELEFDIDYILEWLREGDGFKFRIAPATLIFHKASELCMKIDYKGAGMIPFSLDRIERQPLSHHGQIYSYHWRLPINWPPGEITFDATGFTQTLRREPILHDAQFFSAAERMGP